MTSCRRSRIAYGGGHRHDWTRPSRSWRRCVQSHSHTQPHTQPHTATHSHTQPHTATRSHTHTATHTHSHTTHSHTQPHTATHSHTHSHTQPHTVTHSHTQPHTATHSHTQPRTPKKPFTPKNAACRSTTPQYHRIYESTAMEECKWHNCWLQPRILPHGAMLWRHLAGQKNCARPPPPSHRLNSARHGWIK